MTQLAAVTSEIDCGGWWGTALALVGNESDGEQRAQSGPAYVQRKIESVCAVRI